MTDSMDKPLTATEIKAWQEGEHPDYFKSTREMIFAPIVEKLMPLTMEAVLSRAVDLIDGLALSRPEKMVLLAMVAAARVGLGNGCAHRLVEAAILKEMEP